MRRYLWRGLIGLGLGLCPVPARPAAPPPPTYSLALPAGDLGTALARLSDQTGQQIIADGDAVRGRRVGPLTGILTMPQALDRLLTGQGLAYEIHAGAVLLRPGQTRPVPRQAAAPPLRQEAEVIVIGQRHLLAQDGPRLDAAFPLSLIDADQLAREPPAGLAPLLARLPGLWVDRSAGVAANTVRVRGLPWDGFSALAVQEDGLPIQHEVGLAWTDVDQFFRLDSMVTGLAYRRGGGAMVGASNAPGGLLELTTLQGGDEPDALLRLTGSDYGLRRLDAHLAGPLGEGWYGAIGGFLSRDPNIRRITGNHAGGQGRLNLARRWETGSLTLGLRRLADESFNTSSYPLRRTAQGLGAIPGFDPLRDSWFGPALGALPFRIDGEPSRQSLLRNNENRLTALTLRWQQELSGSTGIDIAARLRRSDTDRASVISSGPPETAPGLLQSALPAARRGFPGTERLALVYADAAADPFDPVAANDNGLVVRTSPTLATTRLEEMLVSARLRHRLVLAGQDHHLQVGAYGAGYDWDYRRDSERALMEVQGRGRLLDLVALDDRGQPLGRITDAGILNYGTNRERLTSRNRLAALHADDQWQVTPAFRLDAGVRQEWLRLSGAAEPTRIADLGDTTTLADNAIRLGTGAWRPFEATLAARSASIGADWALSPRLGLFARASRGFRLPDPGHYRSGEPVPPPQKDRVQQGEAGVKWVSGPVSLFATGFLAQVRDPDFGDTIQDPATGALLSRRVQAGVQSRGLELELDWRSPAFADGSVWLDLSLAGTLQSPRFSSYDAGGLGLASDADFIGNLPRRVPRQMLAARPSLWLLDGRLRLDGEWQYMSRRFADDANRLALPAFSLFEAGIDYQLRPDLSLALRATNLTNRLAVMQGDYWTGEIISGQGGSPWIIGRTLPGRAVTFSMSWQPRL